MNPPEWMSDRRHLSPDSLKRAHPIAQREMHGIQFPVRWRFYFWCTLTSTHASSISIWRGGGRFTLIDVIFIYFWSLWCCVWHYDFWTLCVCRVQCSEGHLRMFAACSTLIFVYVNWIRCRALTACGVVKNDTEERSFIPPQSHGETCCHNGRHIHTLVVRPPFFHVPLLLTGYSQWLTIIINTCHMWPMTKCVVCACEWIAFDDVWFYRTPKSI